MIIEDKSIKTKSLSDLENATFAVLEGFIFEDWILNAMPNAHI